MVPPTAAIASNGLLTPFTGLTTHLAGEFGLLFCHTSNSVPYPSVFKFDCKDCRESRNLSSFGLCTPLVMTSPVPLLLPL